MVRIRFRICPSKLSRINQSHLYREENQEEYNLRWFKIRRRIIHKHSRLIRSLRWRTKLLKVVSDTALQKMKHEMVMF